jgi:peptide/nickel transport system permease protein
MQRFLIRRFIIMIITLIAVSVIVFIMARIGGDPRAVLLDNYAGEEQWEELGKALGLDKPYYHQYAVFMKGVLQGDFGDSIQERRPVMTIIAEHLWATFELALAAFLFSLVVGIPLGVLSSINRGSIFDQFGKVVALIGQSAPSFWLGIMFMFWFAVELRWVPPSGRQDWNSIVLPMITLSWVFIAGNLRIMRSAMLDVLDSEYIKMARAKGVSGRSIIWKHALRNALIPPLTFAGVNMSALMTGAVTTELVFAWPGIGQLAVQSMRSADYPLLQGIIIVFTLMYLAGSLIVDVLYGYIDPRIRYT